MAKISLKIRQSHHGRSCSLSIQSGSRIMFVPYLPFYPHHAFNIKMLANPMFEQLCTLYWGCNSPQEHGLPQWRQKHMDHPQMIGRNPQSGP